MVDWRNGDRTHNNIPPSTNIYIRFRRNLLYSLARRDLETLPSTMKSSSEAIYQSSAIKEIDDGYDKENLSNSDYILRMAL